MPALPWAGNMIKTGRRFLVWTAVVLFLVVAACAVALPIGFRAYLGSRDFRLRILESADRALHAQGELMPLQSNGSALYTDGYVAHGTPAAPFSELRAEQIRADLNWHGLLRHAWQVDDFTVQRLNITLQSAQPVEAPMATAPSRPPSSTPWHLDLRRAHVQEANLKWGSPTSPGEASGMALSVAPGDSGTAINVAGGKFTQQGWPAFDIVSARLRAQPQSVSILESSFQNPDGQVSVSGEIVFDQAADLQVNLAGLGLRPFLAPDWRARIDGRIFADANVHVSLGTPPSNPDSTTGSARLENAVITALPILDQIALFTRMERFRKINLSTATFDFTYSGDQFAARNLVAEASGLLRVEGAFTVGKGEIVGDFKVGVTPSSLQWLPGSRARVFTESRDGYAWAPMRLTGPIDHPSEDLSPRLATAAAGEVIQGVESTVRETTKGVLEWLLR